MTAAAASNGSDTFMATPYPVYRTNVDRIRREFPRQYRQLQADIQSGRAMVVELI